MGISYCNGAGVVDYCGKAVNISSGWGYCPDCAKLLANDMATAEANARKRLCSNIIGGVDAIMECKPEALGRYDDAIVKAIKQYNPAAQSMYLYGKHNAGKTHLSRIIMRRTAMRGLSCYEIDGSDIIVEYEQHAKALKHWSVLVIQDVDKIPEKRYNTNGLKVLYTLLTQRMPYCTIVTAAIAPADITEYLTRVFGDRRLAIGTLSRLSPCVKLKAIKK